MAYEPLSNSSIPFGRGGAVTRESTHRVLRNTYALLALSMVPTVLGAWIGVKSGFSFFSGSPFIGIIVFLAVAFGFFFAIEKFKNSAIGVGLLLGFTFFMGLMHGTRSAIMMDVTTPKVAGTQFTAYMAMANLAIAYSATWLGLSAETLGYPRTMFIDACVGLLSLALIPLLVPTQKAEPADGPARRARLVACVLALGCAAWLPFTYWGHQLGKAQGIAGLFFTLVFVASALVLLAAAAMWVRGAFTRLAPWVAVALLAIYARRWVDPAPWVHALTCVAALAGALLLGWLARQPWSALTWAAADDDAAHGPASA